MKEAVFSASSDMNISSRYHSERNEDGSRIMRVIRSKEKMNPDVDSIYYNNIELKKARIVTDNQYDLIMKFWKLNRKKKNHLNHRNHNFQRIDALRTLHHTEKADIKRKSHHRVLTKKVKRSWENIRVQRNVDTFSPDRKENRSSVETADVSQESTYDNCLHPEYLVYTWVLSLIALASTLKLYFLIKTILAITMVAVYSLFILVFYPEVFANAQSHNK